MAIDYNELEQALSKMKPRQKLYELIKKELRKRGNWKYAPRGKYMPENLRKRAE